MLCTELCRAEQLFCSLLELACGISRWMCPYIKWLYVLLYPTVLLCIRGSRTQRSGSEKYSPNPNSPFGLAVFGCQMTNA